MPSPRSRRHLRDRSASCSRSPAAAEVLPGLRRGRVRPASEPAVPDVKLGPAGPKRLHRPDNVRREQPHALEFTTVSVNSREADRITHWRQKAAVGRPIDAEAVKGHKAARSVSLERLPCDLIEGITWKPAEAVGEYEITPPKTGK